MEFRSFPEDEETSPGWRSCLTSPWQRVVTYMNERPDEPFHFLSNGRKVFDIIATVALISLCVATCAWQIAEGLDRDQRIKALLASPPDATFREQCAGYDTRKQYVVIAIVLTTGIGGTIALHAIIFLLSSMRFQFVIPYRKLRFHGGRPFEAEPKKISMFPSSQMYLGPTTRKLREVVQDAREGRAPIDTATHFLLSSEGRSFLNRACVMVHEKLQIYDGEVVRKNRRGTIHFFLVSLICVTTAMAAAYSESEARDKCGALIVLLAFLDKFSFTLLAVFAVASFAGLTQYSQLVCVREKLCRLTEDEKFLISLIAANSNMPFFGLTDKGGAAGYAVIGEVGETKAFIPMHSSLFAYKEPRTFGIGPHREYDRQAPAADGNYEMS